MIDLINIAVPVVGTIASTVAALVAVEVVRNGKRDVENAAVRTACYADEARTSSKAAFSHQSSTWHDLEAVTQHRDAVKRERTIVTSIARSAKKHAQDAKAERLRAVASMEGAADFAGDAAGHSDNAYDYNQEAKGHASDAGAHARDAEASASTAGDHVTAAERHSDAASDSAIEASASADRADTAAASIESVL